MHLMDEQYSEPIPVIDPVQEEIVRTLQQMEPIKADGLQVYPNPVRQYSVIQVNLSNETHGMKLHITDITGIDAKVYDVQSGMNYIEIGNDMLYPGAYIAWVESNGVQISRQFIVVE